MNDKDRAARQLDRLIDRYAERVGHVELELMLQHRAQDMHEIAVDEGELDTVHADDLGFDHD